MCACRCGIEVTLDEKEHIQFIRGTKGHPVNDGVLCAKGNAGLMKQRSKAKLTKPLLRKPGSARGSGDFIEISYEEALDILTQRLKKIRAADPRQLAFYTGRDQMQALTGLWASQFGTINWAAHGGFCSVNVAAAGLYTIGYSFWEFGEPDWDRTKYFLLWGVAEDHASNPIKIGLSKVKKNQAKFVAINPTQTGYQSIADEWLPIRPGTDGLLALSMVHVLLSHQLIDEAFLIRYTNAHWLVHDAPGTATHGLFYRNEKDKPLCFELEKNMFTEADKADILPALFGDYALDNGAKVKTVMQCIIEQYLDEQYAPAQVAPICQIEADTIERIALEMAHVAFKETIEINTPWTDWTGRQHKSFIGRPVSMHLMRGVSAHSNGFESTRAVHLLQILLGAIDCPGGFRAKAPYPKPIPPHIKPAKTTKPNTPLSSPPLGFPTAPEDLLIDEAGEALRLDKAYSWDAPLANHGLMHMVIRNAYEANPYPIDTLMLFMANMSWNSTMNPKDTKDMLYAIDEKTNEYKIPFVVVIDAFHSETVNDADLVLPDTTYFERHDSISLLDRPISTPESICDSVRVPILPIKREVRPFQDVLVELATRLKFPAFIDEAGSAKYKNYEDFITYYEKSPGIGFLAGFRGKEGNKSLKGEPNPNQWEAYKKNRCYFEYPLPESAQYFKFANQDYLNLAKEAGFIGSSEPITIQLYSEILQKFHLAGLGLYQGPNPQKAYQKERLVKYFSPLPQYYPPTQGDFDDMDNYPFHAINQRPMVMYHAWDSQNAWLRQIIAQNYLYMNRASAMAKGIADLDWVWVSSHKGRIRVQVKLLEGVNASTVWTYNAIGKQKGAWGLKPNAPEAEKGFLMNHLISELSPNFTKNAPLTNTDPITGQAAWYDLKVNIEKASQDEAYTAPIFKPVGALPDTKEAT